MAGAGTVDESAAMRGETEAGGRDAAAAPRNGKKKEGLHHLWSNIVGGLRIALSLRVDADSFCATPGALAALAVLDLLLNLSVSFLLVGSRGTFAYSAIPSFFFHLPLLLFFGYLAGKLLSRPSLLTVIPVALVALSIPVELSHAAVESIAQLNAFRWLGDYLAAPHYYRFFWWWSATGFLFLLRLPAAAPRRRLLMLVLFLVLVVPPLWYFPRADLWSSAEDGSESGALHVTDEVLAAQGRLLDAQLAGLLPGTKGKSELYFVGFAGDATEDVFLKELTAADRLLADKFGTSGRSVILANNPRSATDLPFATTGNLERALVRVGQLMNREEDVLLLYLTSHGSKDHVLDVNNQPLELEDLTPDKLSRMLKKSGITSKVVVVSACYAGGFIDPIKDDNTMVITAADADHESLGCGYGEKFTWFGQAFLNDGLRHHSSFVEAFEEARESIRKWEDEQGEGPSNPQIWVGKAIEPKLAALEKRLEQKTNYKGN